MHLDVEACASLTQVTGISSSYVAQVEVDAKREGMWEKLGCPEFEIWNGIDGKGCETPFTDGSGVDNLAIHALLRRGNNKILSC